MAPAPTIWTVGYERASSDALLAALGQAGVKVLIDVRDLPLSRRAGFSKSTLRASLEAAGIEYLHLKGLGTPKEGRLAARRGDHDLFWRIVDERMATPEAEFDLLRAADIFAMPTLFEGQSNAVLEAMHAGLAIVSSDIPAQVETLGGPGEDAVGDLLPLDDDGAWTRSLEALVRDPALRALMAERARARAQLFTVDRMTDGFERLVDLSAPEGRVFSPQAGLRQRS